MSKSKQHAGPKTTRANSAALPVTEESAQLAAVRRQDASAMMEAKRRAEEAIENGDDPVRLAGAKMRAAALTLPASPSERKAMRHSIGFVDFTLNTDADGETLLNHATSILGGAEDMLKGIVLGDWDDKEEMTRCSTSAWNLLQLGMAMLREGHVRTLFEASAIATAARALESAADAISPAWKLEPEDVQRMLRDLANSVRGEVRT